jgi:hypothetical protein
MSNAASGSAPDKSSMAPWTQRTRQSGPSLILSPRASRPARDVSLSVNL